MKLRIWTAIIYVSAGIACSFLMSSRNFVMELSPVSNSRWRDVFLAWPFVSGILLLFAFLYPRFVLAESSTRMLRVSAALINGVGLVGAAAAFPMVALPFRTNPLHDNNNSIVLPVALFSALCIFLVSSILLLAKGRSSLAMLASLLVWPYSFCVALGLLDRYFQGTSFQAICYFFFFVTPLLLVFGGGAILYKPVLAHAIALSAFVSAPWMWRYVIEDSGLGNVWTVFNDPGDEFARFSYSQRVSAALAIVAIALLCVAVAIAALRLLPSNWRIRNLRLRDRTWPAFAVAVIVLAVWFSEDVMPYRIPGAVDYSSWPMLQILHVQKHGLKFHDRCVRVSGREGQPQTVSFTEDDRRLFEYRFQQRGASGGQLAKPLVEQVKSLLGAEARRQETLDLVEPVRAWNADNWYLLKEGHSVKIYGSVNGVSPPPEIVHLFQDLNALPRSSHYQAELRDVCMGFCFDPLSAMGFLYANHRCFNNGHGLVCR